MTTHEKKKKTKGKPDEIDIHVGKRLRVRRSLLGMSQEKLAEEIGLTFQQVQKYEQGVNRISAGRLYGFGRILDVPVAYFYLQLRAALSYTPSNERVDDGPIPDDALTFFQNHGGLDIVRKYMRLRREAPASAKALREVLNLHVKALPPKTEESQQTAA